MTRPTQQAAGKTTTHVAFLRAINVGGHATVGMKALAAAFEAAGCKDVKTFLQSGNVAFKAPATTVAAWQKKIQSKLNALLGMEVVVIFRTPGDLERMVRADPFKNVTKDEDVKFYVTLLASKPRIKPRLPLESPKDGLTVIRVDDLDVFVVSRRVKTYGFPNILVEKEFGVPATTRNWKTISKVVKSFS